MPDQPFIIVPARETDKNVAQIKLFNPVGEQELIVLRCEVPEIKGESKDTLLHRITDQIVKCYEEVRDLINDGEIQWDGQTAESLVCPPNFQRFRIAGN